MTSTGATSETIRAEMLEAVRLDLVGPDNGHAFAQELLPEWPSRWYLTGFLVPTEAPVEHRSDDTAEEQIDDGGSDADGLDDQATPDQPSAKSYLPSSMGLSVIVPQGAGELEAVVQWGDYEAEELPSEEDEEATGEDTEAEQVEELAEEEGEDAEEPAGGEGQQEEERRRMGFRRIPKEETLAISLPDPDKPPARFPVPNSDGLIVMATVRTITGISRIPAGSLSVSLFLVNERSPAEDDERYRSFAFQTKLTARSAEPFVPRPDPRGADEREENEWDERVADVQYRDVFEYSVGHGVSSVAVEDAGGACREVSSTWIPTAEVERVAPAAKDQVGEVELSMAGLSELEDSDDAAAKLMPMVEQYRAWIDAQRAKVASLDPARKTTAEDMLQAATFAADRIEGGLQALADPDAKYAFKMANKVMAEAAKRRFEQQGMNIPDPAWRPFQLAFVLLSLRGMVETSHAERKIVDLLFFPTGGGKTEAYLGLAAFTLVLRRKRHPGIRSAGLSVLMRYTLRLLTLDQLGRAASVICALELEREQDTENLGEWPFEIGLWVGSGATPNRMGFRGYKGPGKDYTAYTKTRRFKQDSAHKPSPIPIENCPWCGEKFTADSFRLTPHDRAPTNLAVHCVDYKCDFSGNRNLPILGVDEPIYRRLPCFIIATVDKFAALPWTGQTGALFGRVDRYAPGEGFYGPFEPGTGDPLGEHLPGPDLIIQDELHLISGPLGTIAGLYETAIESLASRTIGETTIRPKIVASTATVRRASSQVRALFGRHRTDVFPPPGPDRRDSFFAKTIPSSEEAARLYVGIAAQGRSLKVVLLRAGLALLGRGQTLYEREGGHSASGNPVDPYMTLLGYFNSLRELGGSRRIVEDEVGTRLERYGARMRLDPLDDLFTDRKIRDEVLELTSRVSTNDVAGAKRRLALPHNDDERVDVALATNMISVGLDIIRLGMLVVLGQPKTSAEYIQATSRVGRDSKRPGLVVTLLNVHKPRDRSHYERFGCYHDSFYRAVEATSVTPFSPRALDRALAAALVGLCRHGKEGMTPALGAGEVTTLRSVLGEFSEAFAERAEGHRSFEDANDASDLKNKVLHRCESLLDDWVSVREQFTDTGTVLQYAPREAKGAKQLLHEPLDRELPSLHPKQRRFRANRSMRDVEHSVELKVKNLNDWEDR
jgi:hypothetical protein